MATPIIFRTWRDTNDVITLFPFEVANHQGHCLSYMHVGQHGAADYTGVVARTKPAPVHEYAPLLRELQAIGYDDLKVYRRRPARSAVR